MEQALVRPAPRPAPMPAAGVAALGGATRDAVTALLEKARRVAAKGGDNVGLLTFADDVRTYAPPEGGSRAARRIVQETRGWDAERGESRPMRSKPSCRASAPCW